ncbi:MAG: DsbC family protein [Gammaproteobacteria bacterium]|nr:DsbC family protein [Gammaproteobacteria bacterium]
MTRKLFISLSLATCLVLGSLALAADTDSNLDGVRARISGLFDVIEPENVNKSPIDGWYKIQKGSIIAYVSEDGRYLLQGDLIDLDNGVNLTDISRDEARREVMARVSDDEVISFAPSDVKYTVTVFTDVGCTYCRRLHSQIDEYLAHGIEVRYLLYPRNGPASREWNTSEEVWCATDRNGALTAAKLDRKFETSACDASIIQDHYVLGQEIGLSGTPAIVLEDGTLIGGYVPADALSQQLEQKIAQASR